MLGKLIKHDTLSMSRLLILLHIPVIFLTFAARYLGVLRLYSLAKPEPLAILTLVVAIVYVSITSFFTQLYAAVYTYRKLFSREGYLTLTLPVKSSTQVLAKFLSGSIWILINTLIVFGSVAFVLSTTPLYRDIALELTASFGSQFTKEYAIYLAVMLIFSVISCFTNMAIILGCLSFGHCFRKHRVLTAIAAYAVLTMLMQMVTVCVQVLTTFNHPYFRQDSLSGYEFLVLYKPLLYTSMIFSVLLGVACYIFSLYVMRRRLNLD